MSSVRGWRSRVLAAGRRGALLALSPAIVLAGVTACSSGNAGRSAAQTPRTPLQRDYEATIAKALPSVVEIDAGSTTGSGVVFDRKGDIVTNAHVVGTLKKFDVRVSVTSEPLQARLVGVFTPDDLAVIRVTKGGRDLRPVRWADSSKAQIGQIVLAMGSPYGLIDSVTQGIVSATGRTVTGPTIPGQPPTVIIGAVQTSAAINPGNSGGALMLLSGYVLGIPTLTATDPDAGGSAQGIGFAIPSNTAVDISRQLIAHGRVTRSDRASLEIEGETHINSSGKPDGVTVDAARSGGAAARAGIKPGDVIAGIGGQQTADIAQLENVLTRYQPGDRVQVELLRGGNPREVMATLGSLSG
jgi:S1-C subfamily serine protease